MASGNEIAKINVLPDAEAASFGIYAKRGLSLSDAIDSYSAKAPSKGGLPFDMLPEYDPLTVLPIDALYGTSVLPAEMDDEEDEVYATLVR